MANDSDPDGDNIFFDIIVQQPSQGNLSFGAGNAITYTVHNGGYVGPDSFSYRIKHSLGLTAIGTVNIDVVNQAPVAAPDNYTIRGSHQLLPGLLENDFDPDNGDTIFFDIIVAGPSHGNLSFGGGGVITYNPQGNFAGTDSFIYRITDNLGLRSTGTVTLHVTGDGEDDGEVSCNSRIGNPINVTNGNMYLQQSDYRLPGVGHSIDVTRTYNSNSQQMGIFGRGWSTSYDESIVVYDSNMVRLNQPDGRAIYFGKPVGATHGFTSLVGDFHGQLAQTSVGFTLTMKDGSVHQFNTAGKLR